MVEGVPKDPSRRRFMQASGALLGSYVVANAGFETLSLMPFSSEIVFDPAQQEKLIKESQKAEVPKQACLILGGLTVKDGKVLAKPLTPMLEALDAGPVGYVKYAENGIDAESIAAQIEEMQTRYGIEEFTIYAHSIGMHAFGKVIEAGQGKKPYRLKKVFGDCTPPRSGYGYSPFLEKALSYHYMESEPLFPMAANAMAYDGNPFEPGTALPPLFWDQVRSAKDETYLYVVIDKLFADDGTLVLLRPENAKADTIVDSERSETRLKALLGFSMRTRYVGGIHQGHRNPGANREGYAVALLEEKERYIN